MPEYDASEIVNLIIGKVVPVGESREDENRYESLKELEALLDKLIGKMYTVSSYRDDGRSTVTRSGKFAYNYLCRLLNDLKNNLDE